MRRIEDREQSQKMIRPVDRDVSYGYIVVRIVASLDVDSRVTLRIGLNGRKQADELHRVGISEDLRKMLKHLQIHIHRSCRHGLQKRSGSL